VRYVNNKNKNKNKKHMKLSRKNKQSKDIDYTVFMNIVIGCVAAFAIGLLMTGLLFGGGLRYFSQLAHDNVSVHRAQAAVLYTPQVIEQAQVAATSPACATVKTVTIKAGSKTQDMSGYPVAIFHDGRDGSVRIIYCSSASH
jgi:hypothetical protein